MSTVVAGARAALKLNGLKVAFVGGVNVETTYVTQKIDILDQLTTAENAVTGVDCSFSASVFKVAANTAIALGLEPDDLDSLLTQGEIVMEIYDRLGDNVLYKMEGVTFQGGSGTIDARSVWTGNWNFVGRIPKGI